MLTRIPMQKKKNEKKPISYDFFEREYSSFIPYKSEQIKAKNNKTC